MQELWHLDQTLFRDIHLGWHHDWLDPIFWILSTTGLGHVQIALSFLFLPWRRLIAYKRSLEYRTLPQRLKDAWGDRIPLTVPIIFAWALSGLVNTLVKQDVPRERPSNYVWAHPQESIYANSFSSGHTATAVCIAVTLYFATRNSEKAWIGRWTLVWCTLVGLSRIYRGVHWPSDVLSGAAVGIICACLLYLVFPEGMFWKHATPDAKLQ